MQRQRAQVTDYLYVNVYALVPAFTVVSDGGSVPLMA